MIRLNDTIYLGKAAPSSGGGSIDESKIIIKTATMPTASSDTVGMLYCFAGTSDSNYKHGYIYEGYSIAANTASVTFASADISCSGSDFWTFVKSIASSTYSKITKGEMLLVGGNTWRFIGRDTNNEQVVTYQQYDEDFAEAGFTFAGTFSEGDSVSFECEINETAATVYTFKRIDVQPCSASGGSSIPSSVYTKDNLKAGDNVSFTTKQPVTVSDFSSSNYISITKQIDFNSAQNWELIMHVKTPASSPSSASGLFGGVATDSNKICFDFYLEGPGLQGLAATNPLGSWDIILWTSPLSTSTDYYLSLKFTGTQYIQTVASDKDFTDVLLTATQNSTTKITNNSTLFIGKLQRPEVTNSWFTGTIYLSDCLIKLDDVVEFDGSNSNHYQIIGSPTVVTGSAVTSVNAISFDKQFAPYIQSAAVRDMNEQETVDAAQLLNATGTLNPLDLNLSKNDTLKKLTAAGESGSLANLSRVLVSNNAPFDSNVSPQLDVKYSSLTKTALVNLFNSMPYNVGYDLIGSPTITNGIVSGFTTSNYLRTSMAFDFTQTNYEMVICATPHATASRRGAIIGSYGSGMVIYFTTTAIYYYPGTGVNGLQLNGTFDASTFYYVRAKCNNGTYSLEYSTDGVTYTGTVTGTGTSTLTAKQLNFGYYSADGWDPLEGDIDMNNTYIKISDALWFRGTATQTKTCDVRGCTGTADLESTDKAIVTDKGWSLTVA